MFFKKMKSEKSFQSEHLHSKLRDTTKKILQGLSCSLSLLKGAGTGVMRIFVMQRKAETTAQHSKKPISPFPVIPWAQALQGAQQSLLWMTRAPHFLTLLNSSE